MEGHWDVSLNSMVVSDDWEVDQLITVLGYGRERFMVKLFGVWVISH